MYKNIGWISIALCMILLIASGCEHNRATPTYSKIINYSDFDQLDPPLILDKIKEPWKALEAGDMDDVNERLLSLKDKDKITPKMMFLLGDAYLRGIEVEEENIKFPKDTRTGFKLVSLSALGRHSPAQVMLAAIYLDGKVVEQDLVGAYLWSTIAVRNPNAPPDMADFVQKIQASARSQMTPEEFEEAQEYINR